MNIYTTDKIRNVALVGHGGSGKTVFGRSNGIFVRNYLPDGEGR